MRRLGWLVLVLVVAVGLVFALRSDRLVRFASKAVHELEREREKGKARSGPVIVEAESAEEEEEEGARPNDWFYMQRAWPFDTVGTTDYHKAVKATVQKLALAASRRTALGASVWQLAGPTNIPGRITDIEAIPSQPNKVYAASAAGGVFYSTDYGQNWVQIFDSTGNFSIGDIAINPNNPDTVFIGTGEANPAFDTYEGNGIYRSIDGGATWQFSGLPNSYRIGRIIIDPTQTRTILAAAGGKVFGGTNPDRGVYRSTDGGDTWTRTLYVSDTTGCVDLALHPSSGVVFAAMWQRLRIVDQPRLLGGPQCGLYRSSDRGLTWTLLKASNGLPNPSATSGRIGVAVDPGSTRVYAIYADNVGNFAGLYVSYDLGLTWSEVDDTQLFSAQLYSNFGWYFGQVRTAPNRPNIVYAMGVDLYKSTDGGLSWNSTLNGIHVDQHAMWINPNDSNQIYEGCDGGVNYSTNGGASWAIREMHNTQFYAVTIDRLNPVRLYGGAQDNGTMRTLTGAVNDYQRILGGDGFYVLVDPTDANIVYAEFQNGNLAKSYNGGANFNYALNGIDFSTDRHGWCTPIVIDPSNHLTIYYGSNFLYKSTDGADSWSKTSPDLTNGPHTYAAFGTITTIDVSPANGNVVYVGTDDANVWVTRNGGSSWTKITTGLPSRWVTRVTADPIRDSIAYVTISGHFNGLDTAHVYRTTNYGASWTAINGDLPQGPVNDIVVDPSDTRQLFVCTDFGVYVSSNLGSSWSPLGTGLPVIPVDDIAFDDGSRTLVAGTHGRSMYSISVPTTSCCHGVRGNVNCSGIVDLADLSALVSYLTAGGFVICCQDAANVNGLGIVDLADLAALVSYLTSGGYVLPNCP